MKKAEAIAEVTKRLELEKSEVVRLGRKLKSDLAMFLGQLEEEIEKGKPFDIAYQSSWCSREVSKLNEQIQISDRRIRSDRDFIEYIASIEEESGVSVHPVRQVCTNTFAK